MPQKAFQFLQKPKPLVLKKERLAADMDAYSSSSSCLSWASGGSRVERTRYTHMGSLFYSMLASEALWNSVVLLYDMDLHW